MVRRKHSKKQPWIGPFKIVKQIGSKIYELIGKNDKTFSVHYNQLKLTNPCTENDFGIVPSRGRPRLGTEDGV
ncbi:hypothetical protein BLA29_015429 [Euroglyphus maynei]|uniref:Uncharacterized protein n=1 Tax=Euroglyphus maynei TaxID=6958 RepID=A0A1Y3AX94_EURMA|nr:hypothetical protein BLA29_015429 [Euroglyphus maynei]